MLNGVMLLWFILTGLSVLFVAVDIRATPESKVLKWGFVLLRDRSARSCTYWVVESHYLGCTRGMSRHVGGRCWAPLCIASPGMGLAL